MLELSITVVLALFLLASLGYSFAQSTSTSWLENVIPRNYSTSIPPGKQLTNGTRPTEIIFRFTPKSVMHLSAMHMEFEVDLEFSIYWKDPMLEVPDSLEESDVNQRTEMPREIALRLWSPELVMTNCKGCPPAILDAGVQRFRFKPSNQEFYIRYRKSTKFVCHFDLSKYPFDAQFCKVRVKKTGTRIDAPFTASSMQIVWPPDKGEISVPPEFRLIKIVSKNCTNTSRGYTECIDYWFGFQRVMIQHIMLLYIPSFLIVSLSWISFWLDVTVAPPRIALGLTTLLTLATQFNNAQNKLPPVATIKALDVWMFACLLMVYSSLMEFAIANYWTRHIQPFKVIKPKVKKIFPIKGLKGSFRHLRKVGLPSADDKKRPETVPVDKFSRVAFPLSFVIFNIIYWGYYTSKANHQAI